MLNKQEKKKGITRLIMGIAFVAIGIVLNIVTKLILKNDSSYSVLAIAFIVAGSVAAILSVISLVIMKKAKLTLFEEQIEGFAGKHSDGYCLGMKEVRLAYSEIVSVERPGKNKKSEKYIDITAQNGKKYRFAVEECEEIEKQIRERIA